MDIFEDTFQHPVIVCSHNLDLSNFEDFANQLSNKLILTIEMRNNKNFYIKTVEFSNAPDRAKLIRKESSLIPGLKFELILDEYSFLFHDNFIEIITYFEIDYFHLFLLHQKSELKEILLFSTLFNQLKILGIEEVLFGVFADTANEDNFHYCYENISRDISNSRSYFKLKLLD